MMECLIKACSHMRVSFAAAEVFSGKSERMANLVSAQIQADQRVPALVGSTPYTSLRDSHNNRANVMKFVFQRNAWEIMARTVCWEYRTQHTKGLSYDYFPIEFAAWKRAVQHLEHTCAKEISTVFDWLIEHHETAIKLSQTGEGLHVPVQRELSAEQDVFLALLLQGNSRGVLDAHQTVHNVAQLKRFYLDLISPVLQRVGLLWEKNEISVAEEHLATAIVGRTMAALYLRFAQPDGGPGKVALVAAGPNELHDVGARMVADFLELEGWDVTYLGGNLSAEEIFAIVKRLHPLILSLSVTSVFHLEEARQLIRAIKSDAETQKVRIMLGGFVFNCLPRLWHDFQADSYATDAEAAASAATVWWEQINR